MTFEADYEDVAHFASLLPNVRLNMWQEADNLHSDTQLFINLANDSILRELTELNLAARQFPFQVCPRYVRLVALSQ